MSATPVRRTIGGNIWRTGVALAASFAILAVGAGWWQVVDAQRLSRAADNPAVIAVARRALRGPIVDRDGRWLARSERDKNGEAVREYRDDSISQVVGYASRQYGTAGLERTYNAELIGLGGADPFGGLLDKFDASRRQPLGLQTTLDLRLQRAAVDGLGSDRGAVVMLDPSTGDVLALASTPTFDAGAIADPDTAAATFAALQARRRRPAPAARDPGPLRPGLGVQDRDRDRGPQHGLDLGRHDVPAAAQVGEEGPAGRRLPDPRRPSPADRQHRARPGGRHRGELQHLVRARRDGHGRRQARRPGGAARLRRPDPVRPADGPQPRHRRRRSRARWVRRRRRARVRIVRPGRDLRDPAPDGARGVDGRERRRARPAATRERVHGGRDGHAQPPGAGRGGR